MTIIAGMPIARLRESLKTADDETLQKFFHAFSMAFATEALIESMSTYPGERAGLFFSLAQRYPEDWAKALEMLNEVK